MDDDDNTPGGLTFAQLGHISHQYATLGTGPKILQESLETFQTQVQAIALEIRGSGKLMSEDNISTLIEKAHKLKLVQFKNPTAYVLGYIASGYGSRTLKKENFRYVFEKIWPTYSKRNYISREDVIRYAMLWKCHLSTNNDGEFTECVYQTL